jgi:hypothetical protein
LPTGILKKITDKLLIMDDSFDLGKEKTHENEVDYDISSFTHKDLIEITKTTLNEVLERDSLLSDLPRDVTREEVNAQIALEHGQSMTVYVERADGDELPVVVSGSFINPPYHFLN